MDKHQPDTCVQCGEELALASLPELQTLEIVVLYYCPNPACPNYGLVAVGRNGVDNG
jgi:hypothetical protein